MTTAIQLNDALSKLATLLDLNADDLIQYAASDTIGGYSPVSGQSLWPIGSIFDVEGRVLFAVVRAMKPLNVFNLGVYHGASVAHIAAALKANGNPKARVYAVDREPVDTSAIAEDLLPYVKFVESDAAAFLQERWPAKVSVIFEDLQHEEEPTREVWEILKSKLNIGGIAIAHDYAHPLVGPAMQAALEGAEIDGGLPLLISPSDCGLYCWRQSSDV